MNGREAYSIFSHSEYSWVMHSADTTSRPISSAVGSDIRLAIRRSGKTQDVVARELHVSSPWVNRRINGHVEITLEDLQRLADVLDIRVQDLLPPSWR